MSAEDSSHLVQSAQGTTDHLLNVWDTQRGPGPPGTTRDRREVVTSSNFQALMMTEVPKSTLPAVLLSPLETLNGEGVNGTPIAGWFVSKSH